MRTYFTEFFGRRFANKLYDRNVYTGFNAEEGRNAMLSFFAAVNVEWM